MGNCIVIQKSQSTSNSKLQWSTIKENRLHRELSLKLPQSPAMAHAASFQEFSSKDEIFFDANVCMDSDCDDFFSVNGDTHSRGTTPVHPSSCSPEPSKLGKSLYAVDPIPQPSPTEMKQLIEFFRDSFSGDNADRDQYLQGFMESKESQNQSASSPAISNVESTPVRGLHFRKQKSPRSAQCCLPSLVRSLSVTDKKKRSTPADSG